MSFSQLNLHPNITKAVAASGYTIPTPIQLQSIPSILQGRDLVASARTGTGKTAAFVLPALHRLSTQEASKKTRILILTPTRELANQITQATGTYGKFLKFRIVNLVGGMPYYAQIKALSQGADIIIATPGRLLDHVEQRRVDLSALEMLVLDEADRMLDMGFINDVERIAKLTPAHRQTLLFSATIDSQLTTLVRHLLKNPARIDLSHEKLSVPKIEQCLYKINHPHHKSSLLSHVLKTEMIYKAIIFSGTKINADKLAHQLSGQGFSATALHGDLRQSARNRAIEQFRRGKIQFLVATDVAARGIDIGDVTHVINYDLPKFCEDYVHRIGRTGRAGKSGAAISFVLPTDTRNLQRIERYTGQRIQLMPSPAHLATLVTTTAKNHPHGYEKQFPKRDHYRGNKPHQYASKKFSPYSEQRRSTDQNRSTDPGKPSKNAYRSHATDKTNEPFHRKHKKYIVNKKPGEETEKRSKKRFSE